MTDAALPPTAAPAPAAPAVNLAMSQRFRGFLP
ncbi:MAG TPA: ribonuclease T, partial [Stenotrophomonas sp.]|nr:ribonuclease T [Stenotrophomonas sp.]